MGENYYNSSATTGYNTKYWIDKDDSTAIEKEYLNHGILPVKLNRDALKDNYVEETTNRDILSTEGWTILKVSIGKNSNYFYSFVTNSDAWLEKFEIVLYGSGHIRMILVSGDCPDYYLADPEDIIKFADQAISDKVMTIDEAEDELAKMLSNLSSIYDLDTPQGFKNATIVC